MWVYRCFVDSALDFSLAKQNRGGYLETASVSSFVNLETLPQGLEAHPSLYLHQRGIEFVGTLARSASLAICDVLCARSEKIRASGETIVRTDALLARLWDDS